MITIENKRVKGNGEGTKMGFPTVNFFIKELSEGLSIGLWAGFTKLGNSISLISNYKDGFRIETHIVDKFFGEVKEDEIFKITLVTKLRDYYNIRDIQKTISEDRELAKNFFINRKSCFNCQLFCSQDYGYSNYTVEGTSYKCYANKFEENDGDRNITFNAINCDNMIFGNSWTLDVDGENEAPSEDWIKSIKRDSFINNILS